MNTLLKRTLFGALFVTVMVGSLLLGFPYFAGVVLVLTGLSLIELYNIFKKLNYKPNLLLMLLVGMSFMGLAILQYQGIVGVEFLFIPIALIFITPIVELFSSHHRPLENVSITLFSWLYILIPFFLILDLTLEFGWNVSLHPTTPDYSPYTVLGIFILMWAFDSFAYLTGSWLGKNKMAERISPKKSWEGFAGGLISTVLISLLVSRYIVDGDTFDWIVIALITAVFGTFGDLLESKLKREAGIKDSGNIIPGHGGILDRFDAILLVIPAVFIYLKIWPLFQGVL